MVFFTDLTHPELNELHPWEEAHSSSVLALRMLYSSLSRSSDRDYDSFLHDMDPRLRRSIEPLDVLYFWRQAGGIAEATPWMAVFAVDQAGAVRPRPTLQNPSWLQCALGCFVELRKDAAWLEGQNELLCMPVAITASTHASASSLRVTARHSWTVDIHLRPLTDVQMQAVIVGLAKRSTHCPEIPSPLPPKSLLLLQLVGGNPQLLCQTMCLLAGSWVVHNQQFPAGRANCWKWLQGDFSLVRVVNGLCETSLQDIWAAWKASESVQVNLLNQLVAHSVCRKPVDRQELVPGSEAAGTPY